MVTVCYLTFLAFIRILLQENFNLQIMTVLQNEVTIETLKWLIKPRCVATGISMKHKIWYKKEIRSFHGPVLYHPMTHLRMWPSRFPCLPATESRCKIKGGPSCLSVEYTQMRQYSLTIHKKIVEYKVGMKQRPRSRLIYTLS